MPVAHSNVRSRFRNGGSVPPPPQSLLNWSLDTRAAFKTGTVF
jgi:hypothetical protein